MNFGAMLHTQYPVRCTTRYSTGTVYSRQYGCAYDVLLSSYLYVRRIPVYTEHFDLFRVSTSLGKRGQKTS